jgi:hypothetical protein
MFTFYGGARIFCIATRMIISICCNLGESVCNGLMLKRYIGLSVPVAVGTSAAVAPQRFAGRCKVTALKLLRNKSQSLSQGNIRKHEFSFGTERRVVC